MAEKEETLEELKTKKDVFLSEMENCPADHYRLFERLYIETCERIQKMENK